MFKKISILYKENDSLAFQTAVKIKQWLKEKEAECIVFHSVGASSNFNNSEIMAVKSSDVVIVLGGDGTMLSASRIIGGKKVLIIGINMGSLGFITEIPMSDLWQNLELIFSCSYEIEERSMLNAQVFRDHQMINEYLGLNDIVIGKGAEPKIPDFALFINNRYVSTIKADGIIISTPTGSTAYSLSAGGPILYPTLKGVVFTPICPHTLSVRPIVLPDDFIVDIVISRATKDISLMIDGQVGFSLKKNDRVRCKIADEKTYLIASVGRDYFRVLREKFRWGER